MNDKQQLMAMGEEMAERCLERVTVRREAVEWLKTHFPELTVKAGLCERVGGALYTRAFSEGAATLRQRDELLAALEALVRIIADTPRPDPDDVFATIDEARNVINKVRGEI